MFSDLLLLALKKIKRIDVSIDFNRSLIGSNTLLLKSVGFFWINDHIICK